MELQAVPTRVWIKPTMSCKYVMVQVMMAHHETTEADSKQFTCARPSSRLPDWISRGHQPVWFFVANNGIDLSTEDQLYNWSCWLFNTNLFSVAKSGWGDSLATLFEFWATAQVVTDDWLSIHCWPPKERGIFLTQCLLEGSGVRCTNLGNDVHNPPLCACFLLVLPL